MDIDNVDDLSIKHYTCIEGQFYRWYLPKNEKKKSGKGKQQLFDSLSLLGTINNLLDQWLVDWTPGWMLQGQAEARIIVIVLWDSQYPYNYG